MADAVTETDYGITEYHKIGTKISVLSRVEIVILKMRTGCRSQVTTCRKAYYSNLVFINAPFFSACSNDLDCALCILDRAYFFIDHYFVAGQPVFKYKGSNNHFIK